MRGRVNNTRFWSWHPLDVLTNLLLASRLTIARLPAAYDEHTNSIDGFGIHGFIWFSLPNSDAFELTAWTVPQQKSTASSQPGISAPEDRKLGLTLPLKVNVCSYDLPTSGQKRTADDDDELDLERLRRGIATDVCKRLEGANPQAQS